MQKIGFSEALDAVVLTDTRFDREAYVFLKDALDHTVKARRKKRQEAGASRHVTGQELLEGIRTFALKEFGPMVVTVFAYWGVKQSSDFGTMVYNLIEAGAFGKTPSDSIDDFKDGYDFEEAFVKPFKPDIRPVTDLAEAPARTSGRSTGDEVRK